MALISILCAGFLALFIGMWRAGQARRQWHVAPVVAWWRHQMETFSALLAICAGNSPVPGEFPTQRPVTRSFDVYFDLRPNKQSLGWWFETLSPPLWRHRNGFRQKCRTGAWTTVLWLNLHGPQQHAEVCSICDIIKLYGSLSLLCIFNNDRVRVSYHECI